MALPEQQLAHGAVAAGVSNGGASMSTALFGPSKQQLVSKVLATGLTDFDDDSDSLDEHQQQQQQQQQQPVLQQSGHYGVQVNGVGQQQAAGLSMQRQRATGQAVLQQGGSIAASPGVLAQADTQQQGEESDEFDF
jgi:hypothetical protein